MSKDEYAGRNVSRDTIIKNSNYDNAYEALDEYKLVLVIDNGGGESSVEMKEDFEITRIEGTLVLE